MDISLKFDLGAKVVFLKYNKLTEGTVIGINISMNYCNDEDEPINKQILYIVEYPSSASVYSRADMLETELFNSKQELCDSL